MPIPSRWHVGLVTVLVGIMASWLVWQQFFVPPMGAHETLPDLRRHAQVLQRMSDPVERDKLSTPLAGWCRSFDRALAPDARVFLSGALGKDNHAGLRHYYFLRNYLFPRTVEISLDGRAVFSERGFEGLSSEVPDELRAHGFDVLLRMPIGRDVEVVPLTAKGVSK